VRGKTPAYADQFRVLNLAAPKAGPQHIMLCGRKKLKIQDRCFPQTDHHSIFGDKIEY
jgi:hypothetical protein